MASLKDLRNRISSVRATQKITRAMQMVAASKLRRAQEIAEYARPYAEKMRHVLAHLAFNVAGHGEAPPLLVGTGRNETHLLVVLTSDRGLCGGFNSSIVRRFRQVAMFLRTEEKRVKVLCVGCKGVEQIKQDFSEAIVEVITFPGVKSIGLEQAQQVSRNILTLFNEGGFDVCTLFYANFINVMVQEPVNMQIIPTPIDKNMRFDLKGAVYDYEPEDTEILDTLLPRNITIQILRAMLENAASEQGARMSAMDSATRNAGTMIDKLTKTYNRSRQAKITEELIEIISGAEAL